MSSKNRTRRQQPSSQPPSPPSRQIAWKRVGIWVGSMAVVVGLTTLVVTGAESGRSVRPEAPEGTETVAVGNPLHVPGGIEYPQVPPAGGEHDPTPLACGYYDFVVPDENVVHSMEHGVVWVTYEPGVSEEELSILRDFGGERETIVSLLPDQGSPIIGTAWAAQIRLDSATDPRLEQFVDAFRDAPSSPEALVSCAGGAVPAHP